MCAHHTKGQKGSQNVKKVHKGSQKFKKVQKVHKGKKCQIGLKRITKGLKCPKSVTKCHNILQWDTKGYKGLQWVIMH